MSVLFRFLELKAQKQLMRRFQIICNEKRTLQNWGTVCTIYTFQKFLVRFRFLRVAKNCKLGSDSIMSKEFSFLEKVTVYSLCKNTSIADDCFKMIKVTLAAFFVQVCALQQEQVEKKSKRRNVKMQKKKIQYNRSNITKEKEKFFYVNFKIYFGS